MAANSSTLPDETGAFEDWIEIHNVTSSPVNLLNWSLTDSVSVPAKWRFPATNLPPGGYLVLFASGKDRRIAGAPLHTNFKLTASGEYLALVEPDGVTVATQFAPFFSPQLADISQGFGSELHSTVLLTAGIPARYRVPAPAASGTDWTVPGFDDAEWSDAANGIGYETGQLEFNGGAAANAIQASQPLLHLRLEDAAGSTAPNVGLLGTAANGTYRNGVLGGQAGPQPPLFPGFEPANKGARFDGVDDKIEVPFLPALNSNVFTVEVWAKVNGGAGTYRSPLTSRDDAPQRGYIFYAADNNTWQFWTGTGGGWHTLVGPAVVNGQWTHLAGVYDGTNKSFYVNGRLAGTQATPVPLNTARVLRVGAGATEGDGTFFFNGDIDEVAVFGRALSGAEVLGHFSAATNAAPASPGPPTNFVFASAIRTDIGPAMHNVSPSVYVRIPFVLTNLAGLERVTLRVQYDDGFAAWLNGQPAAEAAAPATLDGNSSATERRSGNAGLTWESFDLSDLRGHLVAGTNLLALQGLNYGATNNDFLLTAELEINTSGASGTVPRYFRVPTPGAVNGTGAGDLGPILSDVRFTPALPIRPADDEDITVTARVSPAFSPVTSLSLAYRVMFGATNTVAMLDDGQHRDGAAGDGLYGAIIPASGSGPGQMVRFQVLAGDAAGRISRWPLFEDPVNSPAWLGTVVANPSVTSALPIWEWFAENVANTRNRTGTRGAVLFNGEFYDNVGIRERGGFTSTGSQKFDFNAGEHLKVNDELGRVEEANLNSNGGDPSYVRPPLCWEIYRATGHPACAAFPILMRLNGGADRVANYLEQVDERFLDRWGLRRDGALYKFVQRAQLTPGFNDVTDGVEKKTRLTEDRSDIQPIVDAMLLTNNVEARAAFMFDRLDLPALVNFFAVRAILRNIDCVRKNFYFYRDPLGSGEWTLFPWDMDLTWGNSGDLAHEVHPFHGDIAHRWLNPDQWNWMWEALFNDPRTRPMILRRMRSVMDQLLGPAGLLEGRVDALFAPSFPHLGAAVSNAVVALKAAVAQRRTELYVTYAATNLAAGANGIIPTPQPLNVVIRIAGLEANPPSGRQAEEFVCLTNPAPFAVDLSGWQIAGGVEFTFRPGTVINGNDVLYVSPDVTAFRARTTGPRGGQRLLVQGGYHGSLSARGETVRILDPFGRQSDAISYPADPSPAQQFLRITELMYHPAPLPGGDAQSAGLLEFIELRNISTNVPLDLQGVRFLDGVTFDFSTQSSVTSLAPGARVVVVADAVAFAGRYGASVPIAGTFAGSLANSGERLRLADPAGEGILDFNYQPGWYPITDGPGFSLVIVDEQADPDRWNDRSQWRPSGRLHGSPGGVDPASPTFPTVLITECLTHTEGVPFPDAIELHNPGNDPADISGWFLSDDFSAPRKFRIPDGTVIAPGGYRVFTEADFNPGGVGFALDADGDEAWLFSADPAGELAGYQHGARFGAAADGVSFGRVVTSDGRERFVAQQASTLGGANSGPRTSPVVIQEIHYHPPEQGTNDNLLEEYVELANVTTDSVPLFETAAGGQSWKASGGINFTFPSGTQLGAGETILLVNFPPSDPGLLAAFRSRSGVPASVRLFGPYGGKLNNDSDRVALSQPVLLRGTNLAFVVRDEVNYRDTAPWPVGADGFGLSLHRLAAAGYGNEPTNWIATLPSPGTPAPAGGAGSPPVILTQPASQTVVGYSPVMLTVGASGNPAVRYQWRRGGANLPGATNSLLLLPAIQPEQAGVYQVVVFNGAGSVLSSNATLRLVLPASFLSQPQGVALRGSTNAVDYGSTTNRSATFAVSAYSPTPLSYQWRNNGVPLPGATGATLTVSNVTLAQDGTYDVVVTDAIGSVASAPARLTVLLSPQILYPPLAQAVVAGGSLNLSVALAGNPPPFRYEWRRGSITLTNFPASASRSNFITIHTTAAGFILASNMPSSNFLARLIITNAAQTLPALVLQFTVTVLADSDGDGLADEWELAQFGSSTGGDAAGDADGDGFSNGREYRAGTDPNDPASNLRLTLGRAGPFGARLAFDAVSNRTYSIQFTDGLESGLWTPLADVPAAATNRTVELLDNTARPRGNYRLVTPRASP